MVQAALAEKGDPVVTPRVGLVRGTNGVVHGKAVAAGGGAGVGRGREVQAGQALAQRAAAIQRSLHEIPAAADTAAVAAE